MMKRNCSCVFMVLLAGFVLLTGPVRATGLPDTGQNSSSLPSALTNEDNVPPLCSNTSPQFVGPIIYYCAPAACGTTSVDGWACLNHPCCVNCSNPTAPIFGCFYTTGCQ